MSRYKKTSTKNLYVQKSDGQFYLAAKVNGKMVWQSLGTNIRTVAEDKLRERLKQLRRAAPAEAGADYTFSQALDRLLAERKLLGLDPKTLVDDEALHSRLRASFAHCETLVREIEASMIKEYFAGITRRNGQPVSNSYFNRLLGRVREVFERAEAEGVVFGNPARKVKRRANKYSPPTIISLADFHRILETMRSQPGRSVLGADMVEFMGYSGARVNEARNVRWSDVSEDTIVIREPKGKNRGTPPREVPVVPEMAKLLERLRSERQEGAEFVLGCKECSRSLRTACQKLGLPTLTHHDFRHFFATFCLKSGLDVPTVAQLIGHKDKGTTLLKTYTHICTPHVRESVKKLDFSFKPVQASQGAAALLSPPPTPKIHPRAKAHRWEPPQGCFDRYIPTPHTNLYRVTATGEYATVFTLRGRSFRKNLKTWDEAQALQNRDAYYQAVGKTAETLKAA